MVTGLNLIIIIMVIKIAKFSYGDCQFVVQVQRWWKRTKWKKRTVYLNTKIVKFTLKTFYFNYAY